MKAVSRSVTSSSSIATRSILLMRGKSFTPFRSVAHHAAFASTARFIRQYSSSRLIGTSQPHAYQNASKEATEERIRQLKAEIKAEEDKKKLSGGRIFYVGASAFAASELLAGIVAVSLGMTWLSYCIEWDELQATMKRVLFQVKDNVANVASNASAQTNSASTSITPVDAQSQAKK